MSWSSCRETATRVSGGLEQNTRMLSKQRAQMQTAMVHKVDPALLL